ncbi:unnamed protein product, partial [marine sediment metagenome]
TAAGAAMSGGAFHDGFSDSIANEHIDWTNTSETLLTSGDVHIKGEGVSFRIERASGGYGWTIGTDSGSNYLDFKWNDVDAFTMTASGLLGVGTGHPIHRIDLVGDRILGENIQLTCVEDINQSAPGGFIGRRARGTLLIPAIVLDDDIVMRVRARGHDGSAYRDCGYIDFEIDGTPGALDMPGRIVFRTTSNGAYLTTEALRIDSAQQVGINATPDARLEVETGAAEGKQAVTIDQNDADQAFIDFQGTSSGDAANNISTWTNAV